MTSESYILSKICVSEAFFIMTQNQKRRGGIVPSRPVALAKKDSAGSDSPLLVTALKGGLLGLGITLGTGILLITVASAIACTNSDPASLIPAMSLLCLLPSMFAGGFAAAKRVKEAPLLCGILSGGMVTLVTLILSAILRGLPSSGYAFWQSASLHVAAIAFSVLGAFAGNVKRKPKPAKRRFGR
jgi:putative membrane protein (TIGR04086 family)